MNDQYHDIAPFCTPVSMGEDCEKMEKIGLPAASMQADIPASSPGTAKARILRAKLKHMQITYALIDIGQ